MIAGPRRCTDVAKTATSDARDDALPEGPSDADLIAQVRDGDVEAYGVLFARHVDSARRLARSICHDGEADDLVSEAFAKVLVVLQRGEGPETALRPYLLTALRRLHIDRIRSVARTRPTDDMSVYDPGEEFTDTAVAGFENSTAAKAFESLPERWQLVLWHLEVEGHKPAEVAPLLGISANSVSALAYRAREGLRQAFVSLHAQESDDRRCQEVRAQFGAFIRNDISKRDSVAVETHLRECRECSAIYLELVEVNSDLRAILAPIILGTAASAYFSGAAATGGGILSGVGAFVSDPFGKAVAGVSAAVVAVAATVAALHIATADPATTDRSGAATPPGAAGAPAPKPASKARGGSGKTKPSPAPSSTPTPTTGEPSDAPGAPSAPGAPGATPTGGGSPGGPSSPSPSAPTSPVKTPDAIPTPAQGSDVAVSSKAQGLAKLVWKVDVRSTGLKSGQKGTLTVTLNRPAVGIHLDPRCDLINLGKLTCHLTGPGTITLLVTPVPGAPTTLTAVLNAEGAPDPNPGDNRSSVRLG